MATSVRTDEHRVGELVPAHYRFLEVLDLYAGTAKDDVVAIQDLAGVPGPWISFVDKQKTLISRYQNLAVGDRPSLSQCNICGAHIRYAVVWSYRPNGVSVGIITTGLDCASSVDAAKMSEIAEKHGALKEFVAGMRRAARDAEDRARAVPREAQNRCEDVDRRRRVWLAESEDHRIASNYLHAVVTRHVAELCAGPAECFYCSVAQDLVEKVSLSKGQVTAVLRGRRGVMPPAIVVLPEAGPADVTGTVRSLKPRGDHLMMLVQCDGYRVWSVVPISVHGSIQEGRIVKFHAVLKETKDPKFFICSDLESFEFSQG